MWYHHHLGNRAIELWSWHLCKMSLKWFKSCFLIKFSKKNEGLYHRDRGSFNLLKKFQVVPPCDLRAISWNPMQKFIKNGFKSVFTKLKTKKQGVYHRGRVPWFLKTVWCGTPFRSLIYWAQKLKSNVKFHLKMIKSSFFQIKTKNKTCIIEREGPWIYWSS